jgi:hypothetical protein
VYDDGLHGSTARRALVRGATLRPAAVPNRHTRSRAAERVALHVDLVERAVAQCLGNDPCQIVPSQPDEAPAIVGGLAEGRVNTDPNV